MRRAVLLLLAGVARASSAVLFFPSMRRAALLLAACGVGARMPASWYAYGDAAPAGGLVATAGDGCSVTIDTSRTQEWNGGFQIYIVVPQWVEGSLVEVDLGPTVQSLDQCANRSASE